MPDIVPTDPFRGVDRDFGNLRRMMDRLFDDSFFHRPFLSFDEGSLALDLYEKDNQVVVKASLPGFKKEDIDVQLHDGVLTINAKHSEETEEKDAKFYRRERRFGSVSRRLALPGVVDDSNVNAELKDGVLTVTVPVPEQSRPKQIEIKGT